MQITSLTIAPRISYQNPDPEKNPYEARLNVSYNETQMQVKIGSDVISRILDLVVGEIAAAAAAQTAEFVRVAQAALPIPDQPVDVKALELAPSSGDDITHYDLEQPSDDNNDDDDDIDDVDDD